MWKRALAGLLWFGAVWFGYEIAWSLVGVPRLIGPVVAFAIASVVVMDPGRRVWRDGRVTAAASEPIRTPA